MPFAAAYLARPSSSDDSQHTSIPWRIPSTSRTFLPCGQKAAARQCAHPRIAPGAAIARNCCPSNADPPFGRSATPIFRGTRTPSDAAFGGVLFLRVRERRALRDSPVRTPGIRACTARRRGFRCKALPLIRRRSAVPRCRARVAGGCVPATRISACEGIDAKQGSTGVLRPGFASSTAHPAGAHGVAASVCPRPAACFANDVGSKGEHRFQIPKVAGSSPARRYWIAQLVRASAS